MNLTKSYFNVEAVGRARGDISKQRQLSQIIFENKQNQVKSEKSFLEILTERIYKKHNK